MDITKDMVVTYYLFGVEVWKKRSMTLVDSELKKQFEDLVSQMRTMEILSKS